jgi:very-short-patch-repair endonuclease
LPPADFDNLIVDFLAPSIRLVLEVDGGCHERRRAAEDRRDRRLRALGYHVVRVEAEVVIRDVAGAVACVMQKLQHCGR